MGVRIASPNPPICSVCYCAQPELRHVDFDAATDGPVVFLRDTGEVTGFDGDKVQVDDVIICEGCMKVGLECLDLSPEQRTILERKITAAEAEAKMWRKRAETLQTALSEWTDGQPGAPEKKKYGKGNPVPRKVRDQVVARIAAGEISQVAAAGELGVTPQTIYNWRKREKV